MPSISIVAFLPATARLKLKYI